MTAPLSLIDRLVARVAPLHAVQRARARVQLDALQQLGDATSALAGGYASNDQADPFMRRWGAVPRSAAADTLPGLRTQRGQSRDLVRNNPIAAAAINTNCVRAVGTGLAYSAQPHLPTLGWTAEQGAAWAAEVQAEFSLWADSPECDWLGDQNFYEKQDLTLRAMLESGDVFTVLPDGEASATMPYRLRLQTLEADRVGNPNGGADTPEVMAGIRRKPGGGSIDAFYVYNVHPGSAILPGGSSMYAGEWVQRIGSRSGRRRMLQHFKRLRPEQPRGVPYLAPVMGLFKLLGTYTDAEVKAAVVSAFLTVFIEAPVASGPAPVFGMAPNAPAGGPAGDEIALGPAHVVGTAPGEKVTTVNPGRPNPAFGDFVQAVLDQLGAGLFIGSEMLMKKYATSYTAARAAFLDAWKHLLDMRTLLARSFCQPALETWMAEAVAMGRISAPGFFTDPRLRWAYTRAAWRGDSQGSLNPKDEVTAYIAARDGRLITNERATWELFGTDWNDDFAVQQAEHQRMVAADMLPVAKAGAPAPQPAAPAAEAFSAIGATTVLEESKP